MNTREQGDLGEMSAMQWLSEQGAAVYIPLGHSPDVDLVAWWEGRFIGVQVKTSCCLTPKGHYSVAVCTRGGNQSWNGVVKRFDPSRCDFLFALTGAGRRWFIPAERVEARNAVTLGGPKYAEFEIERGRPILAPAA